MIDVKEYYNRVNLDLLHLIPADASCVVEIGCGAGAMGEAFKKINPEATYIGLDICEDAGELAKSRLDEVIVGNIEDVEIFEKLRGVLEHRQVDCIIYGDVLEHLLDPWTVLKQHAQLLSETGVVLACIPNVTHWSLVYQLLRGQWDYTDEGLLDRTHLRFFTQKTIQELFQQANLKVTEVQPRRFGMEKFQTFFDALQPVLEKLSIDKNHYKYHASAMQYVVRAVPARREIKPIHIIGITRPSDQAGLVDVRMREPFRFLKTIPGMTVNIPEGVSLSSIVPSNIPQIILFQRKFLWYPKEIVFFQKLIAANYLIITEFDDFPDFFPQIKELDYMTFKGVHAVQTSTPLLAEEISKYNPEVKVFSNMIPELPPPPVDKKFKPGQKIKLFYGAMNRQKSWSPMMGWLNEVLKKYSNLPLEFVVMRDEAFYEALRTPHKSLIPLSPLEVYREHMAQCDIAFLPLEDTEFNRHKSDLSFVECAARGVAVLASPTVYADTIKDGETGFIYRNKEEFQKKLATLLTNAEKRYEMIQSAYTYVRENRLYRHQYQDRYAWYLSLVNQLPMLNQGLRERAPALFEGMPETVVSASV